MRPKVENIIEGGWDIILSEHHTEGGKWELYNQFEDGEYWWEFLPAELIKIGELSSFDGRVLEHSKGHEVVETTYCYDISGDNHTLTIDRSTYLEDGFLDIYEEECYSIEVAENRADGKRSLYLDLINEPDCPPPYSRFLAVAH